MSQPNHFLMAQDYLQGVKLGGELDTAAVIAVAQVHATLSLAAVVASLAANLPVGDGDE